MQSGSSGARAHWKLWVGGAVGVASAVCVAWWLWPEASTAEGATKRGRAASQTETPDTAEPATGPSRVLEVMVEGCRGPAADTLVFVKVGDHLVSGTTDPRGKVRIATTPGPAEVRARVAGWEGTALAGATDAAVVVRSCRSGEVTGRVWRVDHGGAAQDVIVRLVDATGVQLDETVTDSLGDYRLIDADLAAAAIEVVDEADDELAETVLEPLRPGEVREVNLTIGPTFELVGWVLDVRGEPLAGVLVSILAENTGMTWRTVTDGGGAFQFERAPVQPLRLTADGGDLGLVSRRVVAEDARRIDVTLVLEPTGAVMVLAPPEVKGHVILQSWTTTMLGSPYEAIPDMGEPNEDDVSERAIDDQGDGPQLELLESTLSTTLAAYDETDPISGMATMLSQLRKAMPELEEMIRNDLASRVPNISDMDFETVARIASEKAFDEDPNLPQVLALAASKARNGSGGIEAMMNAESEFRELHTVTPPVADEAIEAVPIDDISVDSVIIPDESPLFERLEKLLGDVVFAYYPDDTSVVARGAIGEVIQVPGAFRYHVTIVIDEADPDGQRYAISCGEVLVPAGRTIEMYCGREADAIITGKVVDARGRPLEGALVILQDDTETMTDGDGAYTINWSGNTAIPCSLRVVREVEGEAWRPSGRVNLQCVPGSTLEVAPITLRREDEAPVHSPDTPFGGIGGALADGPEGVQINHVRADGPLALDGIDRYSTILKVDDEDATSWPVEEMLTSLRGDVGSLVQLQVRAPDGEIIETVIERGLITP